MNTFNPVKYSLAECEFLIAHLGEPPVVALRAIHGAMNPRASAKDKNPIIYPDGVIPASVKPILEAVYELCELEKHEGTRWVGLSKVKASLQNYIAQSAKWSADAKRYRGAPRFPSRYSYDAKGRPHLGGTGADSQEVRTYFGPAGERLPFEISLLEDYTPEWLAPTINDEHTEPLLKIDSDANRIECLIPLPEGGRCGHTESYKTGSRSSYNAARARMSKHLRKATLEVEAHRELHTNEFGAGDIAK